MLSILVIHGPNLNLLGKREREVYGDLTLHDVDQYIYERARDLNVNVTIVQSNFEGEIITLVQEAEGTYDGIVINPGAYTHYSYAILDAIRAIDVPVVEVHLSNISSREDFRKISVTSSACIGTISGFGYLSYLMGIDGLEKIIRNKKEGGRD